MNKYYRENINPEDSVPIRVPANIRKLVDAHPEKEKFYQYGLLDNWYVKIGKNYTDVAKAERERARITKHAFFHKHRYSEGHEYC